MFYEVVEPSCVTLLFLPEDNTKIFINVKNECTIKYVCIYHMSVIFKGAKKSLHSHHIPRLIFTTKKQPHSSSNTGLEKHVKCMHFSDMVFLLALVIFHFFSDENQDIYFSI